jgi:large subunit ribosomal protein L3
MSLGLVGRKIGMTRVFTEDGSSLPVTVLEVSNNRITQIKSVEVDGYSAVQLAHGARRPGRVNKAAAGHYAKAGVEAGSALKEFIVSPEELADMQAGSVVNVDIFQAGQLVDVTGVSKGKGYTGAVRRHNFKSGRATHGASKSHNLPGSIGQCQDPGRVFRGKRMSGHMGDDRKTVQNLKIVRVDVERQLLLVKGAVPGAQGGSVIVRPAVKVGA